MCSSRCIQAFLVLAVVSSGIPAQGPVDRVEFLDPETRRPLVRTGRIVSETPVKLILRRTVQREQLAIPVPDILHVFYASGPLELARARTLERQHSTSRDDLLALYEKALEKAPGGPLQAQIRFRIIELLEQKNDSEDRSLDELRKFVVDYPESRQIANALSRLGRQLIAKGQSTNDVLKSLRRLKADYGKDSQSFTANCDFHIGELQLHEFKSMQSRQPDEAKLQLEQLHARLERLIPAAEVGMAENLRILVSRCDIHLGRFQPAIQRIDEVLNRTSEPRILAAAHIARGDALRLQEHYRPAMWEYLWVDVVYNQDAGQRTEAVRRLIEIFEKMKDDAIAARRAAELRSRINSH